MATMQQAPELGDGQVVLDLRSRRSREVLGFEPGDTAAIHERSVGSPGIPRRSCSRTAPRSTSSPSPSGPGRRGPESGRPRHRAAVADAQALGFDQVDVDRCSGVEPSMGILQGRREGHLEIWVEVRGPGSDEEGVTAM